MAWPPWWNRERIVELPLNARQVTQLITLSGVAVQTAASPGYGMNTGVRISVAGSNDFGVTYMLDGAPNSNVHDGTGLHLPFPDALQEFRLTTGAQEASSGLRSGASVSAVTKSGTNVMHGSLFEFNRDSRFSSPDFFSNQKDGLKRNQFGGTIGGPIRQDRVFFFAGYQGTTTRQMPLNATAFVPTPAMMAGDFTAYMSPACNAGRVVAPLRAPFVDNRLPAALVSPAALAISRRLPTPLDECGRVFTGLPNNQNEAQIPIRLDFQASQAHSFFGRYMLTTDSRVVPLELAPDDILTTGSQGPAGSPSGTDDVAHSYTLGHTWVASSSIVNSFRAVGNKITHRQAWAVVLQPAGRRHQRLQLRPGLYHRARAQRLQRRRRPVRDQRDRWQQQLRLQRRRDRGPRQPPVRIRRLLPARRGLHGVELVGGRLAGLHRPVHGYRDGRLLRRAHRRPSARPTPIR